jgi:hypothetical protein
MAVHVAPVPNKAEFASRVNGDPEREDARERVAGASYHCSGKAPFGHFLRDESRMLAGRRVIGQPAGRGGTRGRVPLKLETGVNDREGEATDDADHVHGLPPVRAVRAQAAERRGGGYGALVGLAAVRVSEVVRVLGAGKRNARRWPCKSEGM